MVGDEDGGQVSRPRTVSPRPASTVGSPPGRRRPYTNRTSRVLALLVRLAAPDGDGGCRRRRPRRRRRPQRSEASTTRAWRRRARPGPGAAVPGGGPRLPSSPPATCRAGAAAVALERDRLDAVNHGAPLHRGCGGAGWARPGTRRGWRPGARGRRARRRGGGARRGRRAVQPPTPPEGGPPGGPPPARSPRAVPGLGREARPGDAPGAPRGSRLGRPVYPASHASQDVTLLPERCRQSILKSSSGRARPRV